MSQPPRGQNQYQKNGRLGYMVCACRLVTWFAPVRVSLGYMVCACRLVTCLRPCACRLVTWFAPVCVSLGYMVCVRARVAWLHVFLPTWSRGRPAALDVHVISPLQQQTLGEAASTPGHALQVGVQRKLISHLSACRSAGVDFIPIVMETLGGLAEDSIATLRSLGKAIAQRVGSDTSVTTKQLFHRSAIALWRGNATLWLHRQPILPHQWTV